MDGILGLDDYAVIVLMLLFSSGIGIYYGVFGRKSNDPSTTTTMTTTTHGTYFLADRKMTLWPVALSTFATAIASASVIGLPTETYNFGSQMILWVPVQFLIAYVLNHIYIPLYYNMGSMNLYKFLEVRYSKTTKDIVSSMMIIRLILFGSNVIYATSTALSQACHLNVWLIMLFLTAICIVYTTLGGMKGVMYADALQAIVMVVAILSALIIGLVHVGGIHAVWKSNLDSGRLDFDFNVDPAIRHTVWTSTLGYFLSNLALMSNSQPIIQRFLTAPTIQDAQRGNLLGVTLYALTVLTIQLIGCVIYTEYRDCDPLRSKSISNENQLVPAFVMKVLGPYPLLPGLFFAGLLSASLSTLSSMLNSGSAMIVEMLILPLKATINKSLMSTTCKIVACLMGVLTVICVLPVSQFANVKQAAVSISAILDGSTLVLIGAGILFPQASSKAVICGYLSGMSMSLWVVIGTLLVHAPPKTKPRSIAGCPSAIMATMIGHNTTSSVASTNTASKLAQYFPLHSISYLWISLIGFVVTNLVFIVLSQILAPNDKQNVSLDVIPKAVRKLHLSLSKRWRKLLLCDVYDDDDVDFDGPKPADGHLDVTNSEMLNRF